MYADGNIGGRGGGGGGGPGPSPVFPLLILLLLFLISRAGESLSSASLDLTAAVEGNGVAVVLGLIVVGLLTVHWFGQSLPSFRLPLGINQDDSDGVGLGAVLFLGLFAVLYYCV